MMALLLLASTTSWTVGKHYCLGHLVDIALFVPAQDCGMNMASSVEDGLVIESENSCCNDELLVIEGLDNLKTSFEDLNDAQQIFLVAFTHSFLYPPLLDKEQYVPNEYYPPPLLVKDIQLLDEVFLI